MKFSENNPIVILLWIMTYFKSFKRILLVSARDIIVIDFLLLIVSQNNYI